KMMKKRKSTPRLRRRRWRRRQSRHLRQPGRGRQARDATGIGRGGDRGRVYRSLAGLLVHGQLDLLFLRRYEVVAAGRIRVRVNRFATDRKYGGTREKHELG